MFLNPPVVASSILLPRIVLELLAQFQAARSYPFKRRGQWFVDRLYSEAFRTVDLSHGDLT
jgi:hypothetical protein